MPLTAKQRQLLVAADNSGDTERMTQTIVAILDANHGVTLLDIEIALRDAAAATYLIAAGDGATATLHLCRGMPAMLAALAGQKPDHNRMLLAVSREAFTV